MVKYHIKSGGKRIRPLLTLGSSKLCGYVEGKRDINLAACVELIHSATLLHDDVIERNCLTQEIFSISTFERGRFSSFANPIL